MDNILVSNATHFTCDVAESELIAFIKLHLHADVPACVAHACGLRIHEIRITKVLPGGFKCVIRHEPREAPAELPPLPEVPEAMAKLGFRRFAEHGGMVRRP